jgi:hypothetical protein
MYLPKLGDVFQVVRRHPNALLGHDVLLPEVRLAFVEEQHWIGLAIISRKVELLELGGPSGSYKNGAQLLRLCTRAMTCQGIGKN